MFLFRSSRDPLWKAARRPARIFAATSFSLAVALLALGTRSVTAGPKNPPMFHAIPLPAAAGAQGPSAAVRGTERGAPSQKRRERLPHEFGHASSSVFIPSGVNTRGLICGERRFPQGLLVWDSLLAFQVPAQYATAYALNDSGLIVGYDDDYRAAAWQAVAGSAQVGLEPLAIPGLPEWAEAYGVNNAGLIVGVEYAMPNFDRAFYVDTETGQFGFLSSLCGPNCSLQYYAAIDVNSHGVIVGTSRLPSRPLLWRDQNAGFVELLSGSDEWAVAINDSGVAVGYTYVDTHDSADPRSWATGETPAPVLVGDGWAYDINNLNIVVGKDQAGACLWFDGAKYSLSDLTYEAPVLVCALSINDCGFIVASGHGSNAFLLIPDDSTLTTDTDGDGLLDRWELCGVDPDLDGTINLRLQKADPRHKDLYVELDSAVSALIGNDYPNPNRSLAPVVAAFDSSTATNPDMTPGIHLHIDQPGFCETCTGDYVQGAPDIDERDPFEDDYCSPPGSCPPNTPPLFYQLKDQYWGDPPQRNRADSPAIREALRRTHRYGIAFRAAGTSMNFALGAAHLGGNDLWLATNDTGETLEEQLNVDTSTLMHELGHTLGLDHGGVADDINFKPNYFSVMNYTWGPPLISSELSPAGQQAIELYHGSWKLDYSRHVLPTLVESAVQEGDGIISYPPPPELESYSSRWVPVGPPLPSTELLPMLTKMVGPVDWDRDGGLGGEVPVNANCMIVIDPATGDTLIVDDGAGGRACGQVDTLRGSEDWSALWYLPYDSDPWQDRAHGPSVARSAAVECWTPQTLRAFSVIRFDCNGNGIPDDEEITNGSVPDANGNGIPDGCEEPGSAGVEETASPPARLAVDVHPVPSSGSVLVRFELPVATRVEVVVLDVAGRHVRQLAAGTLAAGLQEIRWNGKDQSGRDVPVGVYFLRLETTSQTVARKLVLVR